MYKAKITVENQVKISLVYRGKCTKKYICVRAYIEFGQKRLFFETVFAF